MNKDQVQQYIQEQEGRKGIIWIDDENVDRMYRSRVELNDMDRLEWCGDGGMDVYRQNMKQVSETVRSYWIQGMKKWFRILCIVKGEVYMVEIPEPGKEKTMEQMRKEEFDRNKELREKKNELLSTKTVDITMFNVAVSYYKTEAVVKHIGEGPEDVEQWAKDMTCDLFNITEAEYEFLKGEK